MPATTEQRLVDVEIKLMHQDRLLETLNEVIIELRGEIERLHQHVEQLATERRGGDAEDAPADDPPPHY